jgi:uncharacterized protein YjiS (DUF1127 family)
MRVFDQAFGQIRHIQSPKSASGVVPLRYINRITGLIRDWRVRLRQRTELLALDDIELQDMRLSRADIDGEARKPFWKA